MRSIALLSTAVIASASATLGDSPLSAAGACGLAQYNNTLGHLDPATTRAVFAPDADACCAGCLVAASCVSWSFQHVYTPSTPCHLSTSGFVSKDPHSTGNACGDARLPPPPASPNGVFLVDTSDGGRRQTFEGVMVELQSDSIGSYNQGMPGDGRLVPDGDPTAIGVPHDLTPSERTRFAKEVMGGARTIRLALGLYLRGLGPANRTIVGRWPSQMAELRQLQELSGVEGWAPEYWSPPPAWKKTRSYYTGTLESFNASFLEQFCASVVADTQYLTAHGLTVTSWGLQNEPNFDHTNTSNCSRTPPRRNSSSSSSPNVGANTYSQCGYEQCDYYRAFTACAEKIRAFDPAIRIHANSGTGQLGASPIAQDPASLALVDAWTWHFVSAGSDRTFGNTSTAAPWAYGKLDYTNEMEYQPGSPYAGTEVGTVSNVNIFLNTLTFKSAPTGVIMLHAAKPTTNLESLGYGWAWWRSSGSNASAAFPDLAPQHFALNYWTWNSVAPFTKTVPWNSLRRNVLEDVQRTYQRVVAFETPAAGVERGPVLAHAAPGKLIVVVTNEIEGSKPPADFNATVRTTDGAPRSWAGYSFKGDAKGAFFNLSLGIVRDSASFTTTLAANTLQWWYEL